MKKPKDIDDIFNYDEYKSYIFSNVWDQKRNERLLFDDYKCALCGNRNNVQVHHLVYPLHKNYGTESIYDLITVCPDCHRLLDGLRKGQKVEFNKFYKPNARLSCWIYFESLDAFRENIEELKNNFDLCSGDIPVFYYLAKERQTSKLSCRSITITTYLKLKEKYGSDRIRITIDQE